MVRTFSGGAHGSEGPEDVIGVESLADLGGENPVVCIVILFRVPLTRCDRAIRASDIYHVTPEEYTADNLWVDNFDIG